MFLRVFDIDEMFEFFINFFQYLIFSLSFMLFPTLKKIKLVYNFFFEGAGLNFFFRKTILSHFTFYAIFNIKKNVQAPRLSVRLLEILKSAQSLTATG